MKLKKSSRRVAGVFGAGIVAAACALPATLIAQDYPSRSITIVVPFPAGAAVDNLIRPLTGDLQKLLGQPVVVDNKGGAQGVIGTQFVARAKPDGYTLLAGSSIPLPPTSASSRASPTIRSRTSSRSPGSDTPR